MTTERNQGVATPPMTNESIDLRPLMRHWPAGVTVVTTRDASSDSVYGITVSTFTSLSLEPPLISVFIKKTADAAQVIIDNQVFGVSILREDQSHLSGRFAGFDPDYADQASRFTDLNIAIAETGSPLISDALGWFDCKVWQIYDGSTHHIVVGEVIAVSDAESIDSKPLIYFNRGYYGLTKSDE